MSHLPPASPDGVGNSTDAEAASRAAARPSFDDLFTGPAPVQPQYSSTAPDAASNPRDADASAAGARPSFDELFTDSVPAQSQLPTSLRPRGTREKRRRRGGLGCLVVLLVLAGIVAAGYFLLQAPIQQLIAAASGPEDYEGSGNGEVVVMIHEGDNGDDIATTLHEYGVTKSFDAFYDLLLAEDPTPIFQPGAYKLAKEMSAKSALAALLKPENKLEQTVVIPEGTVAADVLQLVNEGTQIPLEELQAAAADVGSFGLPAEATSLEGFLFPATYSFTPGLSAHDVLATLVNRQFEALDSAGVAPENRWKTIVLASLVQKEAGLKDDYYKVARVFLNRLDPNQWESGLLQSDATVAYGTGNTHRVSTTDAEREDANNPYNTYVHPGMLVGPISNPGDLAIDAVLHPADGPWLFFVTWNLDTGETIFSSTADEHQAAVDKWLNWMDEHPEYQ